MQIFFIKRYEDVLVTQKSSKPQYDIAHEKVCLAQIFFIESYEDVLVKENEKK